MFSETNQVEDAPYSKDEVEAEVNRILKHEPRINSKYALESAIRGLEQKYDMLSAGAGGGDE